MGTTLNTLKPPTGATRRAKRVGRGPGSGRGKTSTRGVKGQKARTGHHGARFGFEGGQMPLQRRLPKKGFKNYFRVNFFAVNVGDIDQRCAAGAIDIDALKEAGLVPRSRKLVKILGNGDVTKKFSFKVAAVSASARTKIEKAGGKVEVTGVPGNAGKKKAAKAAAAAKAQPEAQA